jgi:hydrogenase-4 component E
MRLMLLTVATVAIKGVVIPQLLFYAMREVGIRLKVESVLGLSPSLVIGAIGTGLAMLFASTLPLKAEHSSTLLVPSSLATVFTAFLLLTTRFKAVSQVLGYLVLENGIFIFGLLLVEAMPMLVELGVLLDLFVGVFVMGIIIHHVNREFSAAAAAGQLSALRE